MSFEPFQPAKPKEEGTKRGRPLKSALPVQPTLGTPANEQIAEDLKKGNSKTTRKTRVARPSSLPVAEMLKVIEILDPLKHPQKVVVLKKLLQMFEP